MEEFLRNALSGEPDALEALSPPGAEAARETEAVLTPPVMESEPETPQAETITETAAPVAQTVPETPESVSETETPEAAETGTPEATAQTMPETASAPVTQVVPEAAAESVSVRLPAARSADSHRRRLLKKQRRRWLWGFLCGMAVAGALAVGARIWEQRRAASVNDRFFWEFRDDYEETNGQQNLSINIPTWPIGEGPAFSIFREHGDLRTAQEVYRDVNPTVVTVIVELDDNTAAVGTGVIFSEDGYFVTNYHVVQGGAKCRAMLDSGRSYPALFVAGDDQNDLAVLKMDASGPFPAAQFGDSELLTVGDAVYAIGNPLGIEFRGTLTNGIVSAIDRDVLVDGRTMTLIQTNAALNSGNSGGPLINEYGQVVGINVVKMSSRRSTVEGLGFAIPSAAMERLVNDLLTYGESQPEPMIGVSVDSFGTEVEPDLWGIGVLKVEPNSAAERGGVQVGDYIIAADMETISGSRDLLRVRRRYHVGDSMSLTLWRDGERVDAVITFTE